MSNIPLFRLTALNARQVKWLGDIVLVRPISFTFLTVIALFSAAVVLAFLIWGTYTKRSSISGHLVPDIGLIRVFVPQPGIVLQKHVSEGQSVKQGDLLYVLSSERESSSQGGVQASISGQVELRQRSLHEERDKTKLLQRDERAALTHRIEGLHAELSALDSQIEGQKTRVKLAEETVTRYQALLSQDYISKEQVQQRQEELLDHRSRFQGLTRDRISVGRELAAGRSELAGLALRQDNQLAQIDRALASTGQELTESEAKRRLIITAPQSGIATAVAADVGQTIDSSRPVVNIVPSTAILQAHLYAPSKAIGFVKAGDSALIRYQAYPYQKFGHAKGTVMFVSKTAIPSNELSGLGGLGGVSGNSEPLYRVTVNLTSQSLNAYGKPQQLQAGMLLDADLLQDSRRLYEWVLEPLYSLTGKLQ